MEKTIIFHIPHDGCEFPSDLMSAVKIDQELFLQYHKEMQDLDATEFVPQVPHAKLLKFPISRLLCDVERFIGTGEIMEQYGMGFCYEKVYDGTVIKNVDNTTRKRAHEIYQEHHRTLDTLVQTAKSPILLIDLHSFSEKIIVHQKLDKPLPDICIGYDDYLSEADLQKIISIFSENGFSVAVNYPYSGSLIPNCIISKKANKEITSFMIEVNKAFYVSNGVSDPEKLHLIRQTIERIIYSL